MTETTTALVTGANKGLGRETVRRLAGLGWRVFLAARDTARGEAAAAELVEDGLAVEFVPLDVASEDSVFAAAEAVKARSGRLDVLVNNAGVVDSGIPVTDVRGDDVRDLFEVNVFGPVRVTHAFLPLLRASENPRVVMVSSSAGSVPDAIEWGKTYGPVLGYPSSKAALNMITTQYAIALGDIRINAVNPGKTATDMTGFSADSQPVTEGAEVIVKLATVGPDGPTGEFFDNDGLVPW
ncbi:NAD(P)-dependent dehydrogenase (short-subunit alcohol dehydrogenase family) [Kibdelosporangium banguiense]|uniref:NAD(P)-dependent dehydrogenase (Short-subunit alcohol dehydrogenase family) n=1 Tax=Kibdelosporangium banguiense TaxID=1365924 RepID=A0ABS4TX12_9PSEU|nr:SDR family NAD(P)-dependent oxidoreductase [Kibdelosporangium banguiense]MBP2328951.1 NAD(P)-dependent dehydrogenase (short-subunit alcohol dehydrogenase family) [Kibdelosporangium banguiense]